MRRPSSLAAALLPLLLCLLASCGEDSEHPLEPSAKPAPPPPPNPQIAYSNGGLIVMNADGTNQVQLVPGDWIGNPTWAPAAAGATRFRIAYSDITLGQVRLVSFTTTGGVVRPGPSTLLVPGGAEPAWSPLGDEVAYVAEVNGMWGIWITDTTGGTRTLIPQTASPVQVMRPTWRGDGLALAFWQDRDPNGPTPAHKQIQVITRAGRNEPWSDARTVYLDPDPSAGNSLDWARTKDELVFTAGYYGGAPILRIAVPAPLSPIPAAADTLGTGLRPSWSPDDRYLVYYGPGVTKLEIATGATALLTRKTGCCRPAWRR